MKVELENVKPKEIETRSFEIITEELGDKKLIPGTECIVKRCIHTSADFDYADNLCFSPNAVEKAIEAIKTAPVLSQIHRWQRQELTKRHWQSTAVRFIALCLMRMWQKKQRRWVAPEPQQVWTKRLNLENH